MREVFALAARAAQSGDGAGVRGERDRQAGGGAGDPPAQRVVAATNRDLRAEVTAGRFLDRAAERRIRGALARCEVRRAEAARSLGVERTTLYRLMKKFGIDGEGPA